MEEQAEQYASDRAFYNFLRNISSANLYRDKWDSREITAEEIACDEAEQRELETEYFHAQPGTWPFDNSGLRFTDEGYQTGDCNVEPSEEEILGAIQDQAERDGADYEDGFVEGHSDHFMFMQTAEPTDAEIAEQEPPGWHQWWSDIHSPKTLSEIEEGDCLRIETPEPMQQQDVQRAIRMAKERKEMLTDAYEDYREAWARRCLLAYRTAPIERQTTRRLVRASQARDWKSARMLTIRPAVRVNKNETPGVRV